MKRKVVEIERSSDDKTIIYVDQLNAEELSAYFEEHTKKFDYIKKIVLGRKKNDCYKREIVGEIRDVHAMRFDVHQTNGRVYCKQITKVDRTIIVIASELHVSKKVEGLGPKEISIIEKVHSYDYDI